MNCCWTLLKALIFIIIFECVGFLIFYFVVFGQEEYKIIPSLAIVSGVNVVATIIFLTILEKYNRRSSENVEPAIPICQEPSYQQPPTYQQSQTDYQQPPYNPDYLENMPVEYLEKIV